MAKMFSYSYAKKLQWEVKGLDSDSLCVCTCAYVYMHQKSTLEMPSQKPLTLSFETESRILR